MFGVLNGHGIGRLLMGCHLKNTSWCPMYTWNRHFLGVVNLGLGGSRYKILAYIHLGIGSTFHTIRTDILWYIGMKVFGGMRYIMEMRIFWGIGALWLQGIKGRIIDTRLGIEIIAILGTLILSSFRGLKSLLLMGTCN